MSARRRGYLESVSAVFSKKKKKPVKTEYREMPEEGEKVKRNKQRGTVSLRMLVSSLRNRKITIKEGAPGPPAEPHNQEHTRYGHVFRGSFLQKLTYGACHSKFFPAVTHPIAGQAGSANAAGTVWGEKWQRKRREERCPSYSVQWLSLERAASSAAAVDRRSTGTKVPYLPLCFSYRRFAAE